MIYGHEALSITTSLWMTDGQTLTNGLGLGDRAGDSHWRIRVIYEP